MFYCITGMIGNHGNLGKADDDIALSDHENEGELGSDADNEDISDINDDSRHQNTKSSNICHIFTKN